MQDRIVVRIVLIDNKSDDALRFKEGVIAFVL